MNTVEIWIFEKSMISIHFFIEKVKIHGHFDLSFSFTFQNDFPWTFHFILKFKPINLWNISFRFPKLNDTSLSKSWEKIQKSYEKYILNVQIWIKLNLSLTSKKLNVWPKMEVKSRFKHFKNVKNWLEMNWEQKNSFIWKKNFLIKKNFLNPIFDFDFPYKMWILMNLQLIKFQKSSLQSREMIVWINGLLLVKLEMILGFWIF